MIFIRSKSDHVWHMLCTIVLLITTLISKVAYAATHIALRLIRSCAIIKIRTTSTTIIKATTSTLYIIKLPILLWIVVSIIIIVILKNYAYYYCCCIYHDLAFDQVPLALHHCYRTIDYYINVGVDCHWHLLPPQPNSLHY